MAVRKGKNVILFPSRPAVTGNAAVVGKKEGEGPLKNEFDEIFNDEFLGCETFEKAETKLQTVSLTKALAKACESPENLNLALAGDLLNQCIGSSFGMRNSGIPFARLYGACSTMALSLALGGALIDGGAAGLTACVTSSHFCSAERQYRYPLEYAGQRTPSAQWTVTGSGAAIIKGNVGNAPRIDAAIFGKVTDLGVTDANNMGAAMAPAAAQTTADFLYDTETVPSDYDIILTGDLGKTGSRLFKELMLSEYNTDVSGVHNDCGLMIFDSEKQDVHSGGSGCGCSASVVCSYILNRLKTKELNRVLFVATGALLSPTSSLQGESIPGIAHGVLLTSD